MDRDTYKDERLAREADYDRRQSARKDTVIDKLNAEITKLRAELQAERELADRLVEAIKGTVFDYDNWSKSGAIMIDMAIEEHATRRQNDVAGSY